MPSTTIHVGEVSDLDLEGLGDCYEPGRTDLTLDAELPLVVLVHGYHSSAQALHALAEIFQLHDQQTVCYRYDDRESVIASAARLRQGIAHLAVALRRPEVLVFGHSQGGLIARAALAASQQSSADDSSPLPVGHYRLVTVSTPFGGIRAASNCGSIPYHIASFGVSLVVCRAISGAKWNEIHPRSHMVLQPSPLDPMVDEHLTIVTDERDTCRRYSPDGLRCVQDDFVFSIAEQRNLRIEVDHRVIESPIAAGHVEVVGGRGEPRKLLQALQHHGLLRATRPDEQPTVERLTAQRIW